MKGHQGSLITQIPIGIQHLKAATNTSLTGEVNNTEDLVTVEPVKGGIYQAKEEQSILKVNVLKAGLMGQSKDLNTLLETLMLAMTKWCALFIWQQDEILIEGKPVKTA